MSAADAESLGAILFDKDGTLFDFRATWEAWAASVLLRLCGQDPARAAAAGEYIGFDMGVRRFHSDSIVIAGTAQQVAETLAPHVPDLGAAQVLEMLNDEAIKARQVPAVPLAPLLDLLRDRGLKLGVATNDAEMPARAHLGAAGVIDRFDFVIGFDSGYGQKPDAGPLLAFADAVEVAPERVAMIGDSRHDLIAGRSAGMRTVGVLTGIAGRAELAPLADVVLPDIGHIPGWLDR